ncbi:multidrug effflux MFS transporter [Sphingobium subterraneum]|uniref:Bcr/CflA family efflux transporter n=1 Tax=Sphingobium subterraneum TaxID=627688 RepID=A0A841J2Z0_9SPHN|nr:multidrug effflux MFS transporter [Sphingobium subterraneum]MBB6123896.1 DHA1 family bicyclomycin/chloramphenicol resistance-like MFS transporter [Sphingobium subterraneum]
MHDKMPSLSLSSLPAHARVRFAEFVALMASIMGINALSIDPMLPALPSIGADLGVLVANDRQLVISVFFIGIAVGSLIYGPLSDRFGRKAVMLGALSMMLVSTLVCALAPSFTVLLIGRACAGFCAAACRVIAVSTVRDCFRGDQMAKVMSLIFIIFMVVPILAPSFGQLILLFAEWRWIFGALVVLNAGLIVWIIARLPETLAPENRSNIRPADLWVTFLRIVTNRSSMGYMTASGVVMGGLVGFITSVQQIFYDIFHAPDVFPLAFAGMAVWMAVGSFFNSRLVERLGARRLSQSALIIMILFAMVHSVFALMHWETLPSFIVFQAMTMLCFAFAGSNFSSIALEPFAQGAGLASSIQASLTTLISTVLGSIVGQAFNGTTLPLALGFMVFGLCSLIIVWWAERGRLFTRPGLHGLRCDNPAPPPR